MRTEKHICRQGKCITGSLVKPPSSPRFLKTPPSRSERLRERRLWLCISRFMIFLRGKTRVPRLIAPSTAFSTGRCRRLRLIFHLRADRPYTVGHRYNRAGVFGALYFFDRPEVCRAALTARGLLLGRAHPQVLLTFHITVGKILDLTSFHSLQTIGNHAFGSRASAGFSRGPGRFSSAGGRRFSRWNDPWTARAGCHRDRKSARDFTPPACSLSTLLRLENRSPL